MLPVQTSMMQNYLLHRGYPNYTVGHMRSWELLGVYSSEKKKPDKIYLPIRGITPDSPAGQTDTPLFIDTYV